MQFAPAKSIYEQIVDYVSNRILENEWKPGDRLPSVRELAVRLEVNPNTVQRSYSQLQADGLIENQRGVGYFVSEEAAERARRERRDRFETHEIPRISREMRLLDIALDELSVLIQAEREKTKESNQ